MIGFSTVRFGHHNGLSGGEIGSGCRKLAHSRAPGLSPAGGEHQVWSRRDTDDFDGCDPGVKAQDGLGDRIKGRERAVGGGQHSSEARQVRVMLICPL
jgi:hypothetical protein